MTLLYRRYCTVSARLAFVMMECREWSGDVDTAGRRPWTVQGGGIDNVVGGGGKLIIDENRVPTDLETQGRSASLFFLNMPIVTWTFLSWKVCDNFYPPFIQTVRHVFRTLPSLLFRRKHSLSDTSCVSVCGFVFSCYNYSVQSASIKSPLWKPKGAKRCKPEDCVWWFET